MSELGQGPNVKRSVLAVLAGVVAVIVISTAVDVVLHLAHVYPKFGEPMWSPHLNVLALSYRIVIGIYGSYLAARLAPWRPMKHAMIVGIIGFVLSGVGVLGTMMMKEKPGPTWYPVALWLTALPCAYLGGLWYLHRRARAAAAASGRS